MLASEGTLSILLQRKPYLVRSQSTSEMMPFPVILAILEGEIQLEELPKAAARFVTAAWGPRFVSLDATMPGTDNLKLLDTISNETEHF